jgi:hypothetical protein
MKSIKLNAATVQQFVNGINTQLTKGKSVTLGNQPYVPSAMVSTLSGYIAAVNTTAAAKVAYHEAVVAQGAMRPSVLALVRDLKEYAYATYGNAPTPLAAFGLLPRKPPVVSAAERAASAAKAAATRLLRAQAKLAVSAPTVTVAAVTGSAAPTVTAPVVSVSTLTATK